MFRADLLLIIRRYHSVYTACGICHVFMSAGCWQDLILEQTGSKLYILLVLIVWVYHDVGKQGVKIVVLAEINAIICSRGGYRSIWMLRESKYGRLQTKYCSKHNSSIHKYFIAQLTHNYITRKYN